MFDAIVIGGGPGGLQSALTLGRIHRSVLLVDSGAYRNDPAEHLHNLIGFDGTPPADLRAAARRDLAGYATVEVRPGEVVGIRGEAGAFEVDLGGDTVAARAIVLATGVVDDLPPIPGLAEQWGRRVAHCPFCHGHEFAGQRVAILAVDEARAAHLSGLMAPVADEVVVVSDVTAITEHGDGLRLTLGDWSTLEVGGMFVGPTLRLPALVASLGLETDAAILVDPMGRTSRAGIYAVGDTAQQRGMPGPMQSIANAIATGALAGAAVAGDALAHA